MHAFLEKLHSLHLGGGEGGGGGSGVVITNNAASIVNVPHTTDPHSASLENELVICCFQPQCATM